MDFECKICGFRSGSRILFSSHIFHSHNMKVIDYEILYNYGGERPVCKICGMDVRFSYRKYRFNEYCPEHSREAAREWSKNHGFGADNPPDINKGKTKYSSEFLRARSEKMMGVGIKRNKPLEEIEKKRLETLRKKREKEGIGERLFNIWQKRLFDLGLEIVENYSQIKSVNDPVRLRCFLCGREMVGKLSSYYVSEARKRVYYGCSFCSSEKANSDKSIFYLKKVERVREDISVIREKKGFEVLLQPEQYEGKTQKVEVRCIRCGKTSTKTWSSLLYSEDGCYYCAKNGKSAWEAELEEMLVSNCVLVKRNDRSLGLEYDIVANYNEKTVAVELNGLYWHSEVYRGKKYHVEKYERAKTNNLPLIQVFEDEWSEKKEIVLSIILSKLGVFRERYKAGEFDIFEYSKNGLFINGKEVVDLGFQEKIKDFYNKNHVQGYIFSFIHFGLMKSGDIFSCLSFRYPFTKKKESGIVEISRFATKIYTRIDFGFSRILKHATRKMRELGFKEILTYADLRFGEGDVYLKNNFVLKTRTGVDYFYTDFKKRFNRFKFRAQSGKPEKIVAKENGVVKIYGVGHNVFYYLL